MASWPHGLFYTVGASSTHASVSLSFSFVLLFLFIFYFFMNKNIYTSISFICNVYLTFYILFSLLFKNGLYFWKSIKVCLIISNKPVFPNVWEMKKCVHLVNLLTKKMVENIGHHYSLLPLLGQEAMTWHISCTPSYKIENIFPLTRK